jgi:uncharacterized damage-inducible protein DinB
MNQAHFDLSATLRVQAHANRLANHRLHSAMAPLPRAELHAPRVSFFPSLIETLNHILHVDQYYLDCLLGVPGADQAWAHRLVVDDLVALVPAQRASDERLMEFCNSLHNDKSCNAVVDMPRAQGRIQRDRVCQVLAHLFMHQTHHRGQVHAMLSGTPVAPPQLDEFLLPSEPHLRGAEMAAHAWREDEVYAASWPERPPEAPAA